MHSTFSIYINNTYWITEYLTYLESIGYYFIKIETGSHAVDILTVKKIKNHFNYSSTVLIYLHSDHYILILRNKKIIISTVNIPLHKIINIQPKKTIKSAEYTTEIAILNLVINDTRKRIQRYTSINNILEREVNNLIKDHIQYDKIDRYIKRIKDYKFNIKDNCNISCYFIKKMIKEYDANYIINCQPINDTEKYNTVNTVRFIDRQYYKTIKNELHYLITNINETTAEILNLQGYIQRYNRIIDSFHNNKYCTASNMTNSVLHFIDNVSRET